MGAALFDPTIFLGIGWDETFGETVAHCREECFGAGLQPSADALGGSQPRSSCASGGFSSPLAGQRLTSTSLGL